MLSIIELDLNSLNQGTAACLSLQSLSHAGGLTSAIWKNYKAMRSYEFGQSPVQTGGEKTFSQETSNSTKKMMKDVYIIMFDMLKYTICDVGL